MKLPELTPIEQDALIESMQHSFGACTCMAVNGRMQYCAGHRFLGEVQAFGTDRTLVDRVSILAYYRRMASMWTSREFSRPFQLAPEPMLEPDPLPPDLIPESPQQGDDATRLPW